MEGTTLQIDKISEHTLPSKLEPHRDLIRQLRKKRVTYREIARLLHEHFGLTASHSTIHAFVKVRAKPLRSALEIASEPSQGPNVRTDPYGARFTSNPEPPVRQNRFYFDPSKGLTLPDEALNLKPKTKD